MADKILPWDDIINPPADVEDYIWDCVETTITEQPNLVSWCYPGQFQSLARTGFNAGSDIGNLSIINYQAFLIHAQNGNADAVVTDVPGSQTDLPMFNGYAYRAASDADGTVYLAGYGVSSSALDVVAFYPGTTNPKWTTTITGYEMYEYADVQVLVNGNILISWADYTIYRVYFTILNPAGGVVVAVTEADTASNLVFNEYGHCIVALPDGGFAVKWISDGNQDFMSIWNADGTNRVPSFILRDDYTEDFIDVFPNGNIINYIGYYGDFMLYNPATGAELIPVTEYSALPYFTYAFSDKLPSWTDKIAIVFYNSQTGDIMSSIVNDDGTVPAATKDHVIIDQPPLDSLRPHSLIAMPTTPETFIMQTRDLSDDRGQNYYILDENLDVISGPHVAFTGLTYNNTYYCRGCVTQVG